jgi:hypothetical protein
MIRVISMRDNPTDGLIVNTTSRSTNWSKGLSPFFLGPVDMGNGLVVSNVENAWQFSKVYQQHVDAEGNPSSLWYEFRKLGFASERAIRYPMGKGTVPLYSYFNDQKFAYIEARKALYIPIYSYYVRQSFAFRCLRKLSTTEPLIYLQDFDGYDHAKQGMSFDEVITCETKKMGHAFVLAMMLDGLI